MAACLPNLSSPGRERRLSELLQEQQEPFLLDVYLMEKGYSDKLFASPATSLCWPINDACKRLQRIGSHGFRRSCWRRRRRCQLLRCMLAEFLSGRVVRQAFLRRDKKVLHLSEADELLSLSSRCSDGAEIPWKSIQVDDPKQLSPVFVTISSKKLIITDTQEDTSTLHLSEEVTAPALNRFGAPKKQLDQPEKLHLDRREQEDKGMKDSHESSGYEFSETAIRDDETSSWQRQRGVHTSISQLTFSDISSSKGEWYEFQPQVRQIAVQIEEAIFEGIREDVVSEMLGRLSL
ncbi:hypothetical protein B296_00041608 [Ensete ventricosum]|uniref:DUF4378 domain-containing protein n=1 Tax=Ensete ventricosum TaxID=4639 RepID=A0A426ZLB8_ENSVE|nr:hypothetical protein B296_00041608 [Ensete ventricosum]